MTIAGSCVKNFSRKMPGKLLQRLARNGKLRACQQWARRSLHMNPKTSEFFAEAERVIAPLKLALRELVGEGAATPRRPVRLRLNPTLRSRITRGIETDHLPSTLFHLPGPSGLRRALQASRKSGTDPELIKRCQQRIDAYEEFLRVENINRDALQAMVGDLAPEAKATVVRTNGQAVHKAMANLIGYSAETMLATLMVLPSDTPGRCNLAQVGGFADLQQLRAGAWFMTSGYGKTSGTAPAPRTFDGEPITGDRTSTLLEPFCSKPLPRFQSRQLPRRRVYQLVESDVGWRSASTFFFGEVVPDALADPPESAEQSQTPRTMLSSIIATPAKRLHFDVLLHRDVWRDVRVFLDTFRIVPHGPVDEASVEDRQYERIDLGVQLRQFEVSASAFGASRVPRYNEMILDALRRLNVHADALRAYRCEVIYPLYGTQFAMRFERA